jgi:hypothetical protein
MLFVQSLRIRRFFQQLAHGLSPVEKFRYLYRRPSSSTTTHQSLAECPNRSGLPAILPVRHHFSDLNALRLVIFAGNLRVSGGFDRRIDLKWFVFRAGGQSRRGTKQMVPALEHHIDGDDTQMLEEPVRRTSRDDCLARGGYGPISKPGLSRRP